MVPVSIEGCAPGVESGVASRGGSISLAVLIDFIVQRTYHELSVLAELLPRKTDMERKIEIYKFSARTRQLFVRLLALVKWASSASKVDRSAHIMAFLDKQSLLFVDTADMLARVARETLVHARLPTFHMAAAVEVLTLGTYGRLPAVIREKLVPPAPLTSSERRATLRALAHVVRQRLTTAQLPSNIRNLKVENGRATFTIGQEFSVALTVMGDSPNLPWRLLDIAILIQDNETGEGKPLVHQRQLAWLKGVAQTRLAAAGLGSALAALRFFCRSLALELLYTQTLRLCRDRLTGHVQVDTYTPGKRLQISYWRELGCELGYRLIVEADSSCEDVAGASSGLSNSGGLCVSHVPALVGSERAAAALRPHAPSMERLLAHTIHARSRARLNDLKVLMAGLGVECTLGGSPCVLACCVLQPSQRAEQLLVGVGAVGGGLHVRVPAHPHAPHTSELSAALASADANRVAALLTQMRYWLVARRCEKTLQHLPASASDRRPILYGAKHPLAQISPHRLYVSLHRHANHVLVVEMKEIQVPSSTVSAIAATVPAIDLRFHLAAVKHSTPEEAEADDGSSSSASTSTPAVPTNQPPNMIKAFLKVTSLVELDAFALTHGPFTPLDTVGMLPGKRKLGGAGSSAFASSAAGRNTRSRQPAYFLPELAHVVAAVDERVPFVYLAQELSSRGVHHGGLQGGAGGSGLQLQLTLLPAENSHATTALRRRLLAATIRLALKNQMRLWTAELVFYQSPLETNHPKEQGHRRCVYLQYEMTPEGGVGSSGGVGSAARTAEAFLADWAAIVQLHSLVYDFMQRPQPDRDALSMVSSSGGVINIKSYCYRQLVIGLGQDASATCCVSWHTGRYRLTMGAKAPLNSAHQIIHHQLEQHLNWFKDLLLLMVVLKETFSPLVALSKLPCTPQLGLQHARPHLPTPTFTIIPHSWRKIRISYAASYCLELGIRGGGMVAIRDGSYSRFDCSTVVEEFTPMQSLKAFLSRYVDESSRSGGAGLSEDDNPPSPVSPPLAGSGLRFSAPMTPPAGPHTPHSQPLTPHPASPAQHNQPHGSFNLTSPPSGPVNTVAGLSASPASPLAPGASPLPMGSSVAAPSPQQPHGSPFAAWPASPSLPRPSPARMHDHKAVSPAGLSGPLGSGASSTTSNNRVLVGGRAWAGAVATLLPATALDALCTPTEAPQGAPNTGGNIAPLERFLGCVLMRRHLLRFLQQEETLSVVPCSEAGVVMFRAEVGLTGRVAFHPQHMQSLHLQITALPEHKDSWSPDELQVMERFFEQRVAAPPYRPTSLWGWGRALGAPAPALKALVCLMRADLNPPIPSQQPQSWQVQLALRIPPSAPPIIPSAHPGVLLVRSKILFFLCISRGEVQLVLPLVYDIQTNVTQLAEKRDNTHHPHMHAVSQHLKRFAEFGVVHGECSLWPAIRDLLTNLILPEQTPQTGPQALSGMSASSA